MTVRPSPGLSGEVEQLRELVSGVANDAARIANVLVSMDGMDIVLAARRAGYEESLAAGRRQPRMPRDQSRAQLGPVRSTGTPGGAL